MSDAIQNSMPPQDAGERKRQARFAFNPAPPLAEQFTILAA
jgi:hypothetical protein